MRRTRRIHLLTTVLTAAALAAAHAAYPRMARADQINHIWGMSNLGETCSGSCGAINLCCRIIIVQAPPSP